MTLAAYRAGDPLTEHPNHGDQRFRRLDGGDLTGLPDVTARRLLGALVIRDDSTGRRVARIVETEAYAGPEDRASHARAGHTPRTGVMYMPAGHAYVYLVYGMHHCFNVVSGSDGAPEAVLVRAVEAMAGISTMRSRRGLNGGPEDRLAAGPGRTCQALDIDLRHDGIDLLDGRDLWLATDGSEPLSDEQVVTGPRIGVDFAGPEWASRPWRFGVAASPALSRRFPETT